jgi:hypothetical protein
MNKRQLGPFSVNPVGLGCMNLDHAYGPSVSVQQGERVLLGALDAGYDFLDTATLYGGGKNEERVGAMLAGHRNRFVLASKCGMGIVPVDGKMVRVIDGRPETLRRECENSLRRLKTDVIDLYYLHRWDKKVPIEDSVGALSDLVRKGYIRAIGLSEVGAVPCAARMRCTRSPPCRPSTRCGRAMPRLRFCKRAGAWRGLCRLQPGGPGVPVRNPEDIGRTGRQGHSPGHAPFQAGALGGQSGVAATLRIAGPRAGLHARAACAGLAAAQGAAHHSDPGYHPAGTCPGESGGGRSGAGRWL